jgi:geranylgeranyl pyrophosphate synthase
VTTTRAPAILPLVRKLREEADDALAREVTDRIRASGACDDVRRRAESEASRAVEALEAVPRGAARDALAAVAFELVARTA